MENISTGDKAGTSAPVFDSDLPDASETADLVRRAQAGDPAAKTDLLKNFHLLIRKIARKFSPDLKLKLDGPCFDDLVAAGGVGLLVAISRFDLRRNNGLPAYAWPYIEDAIRQETKKYWKRGIAGETRIDRYVSSHPYDTPEQISYALDKKGIRCTPGQATEALNAISARRNIGSYSTTTEGGYSDDYDEEMSARAEAKPAGSHDMHAMYGCFNCGQPKLLQKAISRAIDALAADKGRRDKRRLRAMGGRAYAAWIERKECALALKYRAAVAPLFARTPMTNCISVNTVATASDSSDWKSDQDKFADAAKVQPMVFDEKDRWGWYQTPLMRKRNDRRPKNEIETANAADADERKDDDSIRQSYPRHQATGGRRALRGRGGATPSSGDRRSADEPLDTPSAAHGA
jgi:hypothetical protein